MSSLLIDEARRYVADKFGAFRQKRLDNLKKLKLSNILKGKNFYLFAAKNIFTAPDFIKIILDAHLSSQEKTLFGDFLEGLAIYINEKVYGGRKSTAEGIDWSLTKPVSDLSRRSSPA
ncbi:MAG: hypothetical protein M3329_00225 [Pseudomonadota bacterium]|nr:hypothetical protein [Pseudomonadota bacterium]